MGPDDVGGYQCAGADGVLVEPEEPHAVFLPDKTSVEEKSRRYQMGTIELSEQGAILE